MKNQMVAFELRLQFEQLTGAVGFGLEVAVNEPAVAAMLGDLLTTHFQRVIGQGILPLDTDDITAVVIFCAAGAAQHQHTD